VAFGQQGSALASQAHLHGLGDVLSQPSIRQGVTDALYDEFLDGLGG
jgi:hypothetical protein